MKTIGLSMVMLLSICHFSFAQGIQFFEGSWEEALAEANKQEKLLFVDAYAVWCGPCKRMAKTEFTKDDVGDFYNTNFISLKLDMEKPDGRSFEKTYPVSAYPTMFFLDGDGKVVKKIKGFRPGEALIEEGRAALGSVDYSAKYAKRYEEGERDYDLVFNYLKALGKSGKSTIKIANEFLKENELDKKQRTEILSVGATEADSKIFEEYISDADYAKSIVGADAFYASVDKACENTVKKAIEFEYMELIDEAIEKMKSVKSPNAKAFAYTSKMEYAKAYKEEAMYLDIAKTYVKKIGKSDGLVYKMVGSDILEKFPSDSNNEYAFDLLHKWLKTDPTEANYLYMIRLLVQNSKTPAAVDLANEAVEKLDKLGVDAKRLKMTLEKLDPKGKTE